METYDAVVIGAGHNGLVCAAYLLKAGYSVLLLEKRPVPGGAATTEEAIPEAPGFKFNLCAIDHEFIFHTPVIEELELYKYGLEYLHCDPHTFCPQPDGRYFLAHKSLAKTHEAIARYSQKDANSYLEFIKYWSQLLNAIAPWFNAPPQSIIKLATNYGTQNILDILSVAGSKNKALDFIRNMITSPEDLINEWFDTEIVKAPLARLAAEIGAPPSQKGITAGLMMLAMRHQPGMARPKGGTGALTQSLVKLVTSLGGKILCEQMVKEVLIDDDGRAIGLKVAGGQEYRANKAIISNIDVQRLFLQLVDEKAVDPKLRNRVARRIVNNNETILKIDCALSEVPRFTAYDKDDLDHLIGTVLIADSVAHVEQAHSLANMGQIPDSNPSMYLDIPSVLDPTLAPEGKHTLWIEFFAPYQIAGKEGTGLNGTGWTDELKNRVADNVLAKLAQYAPNIKDSIIARRVESPAELGERLGSYKGNYYHLDMTLDQMIFLRPLPEIANYTTPIKNLYLTGAGTHPGGSISGMPGRNCAQVFLSQQNSVIYRARESINSMMKSLLKQ